MPPLCQPILGLVTLTASLPLDSRKLLQLCGDARHLTAPPFKGYVCCAEEQLTLLKGNVSLHPFSTPSV